MSSVTEVKQAPGRWNILLDRSTPRELVDALTPFGHIAIAPGEINVEAVGDNLLREARYVGVFRGGKVAGEDISLTGSGMPFWLGDEDGKGPLIESVSASSATFAQAINAVLPAAIEAGTIYSTAGSMTHRFQYEQPRTALNFIMNGFATPTVPVSWRVNGDATLDAGPGFATVQPDPDRDPGQKRCRAADGPRLRRHRHLRGNAARADVQRLHHQSRRAGLR